MKKYYPSPKTKPRQYLFYNKSKVEVTKFFYTSQFCMSQYYYLGLHCAESVRKSKI